MCSRFRVALTAVPAHRLPMSSARRALLCHLAAPLPTPILSLMEDFRRMVNRGIREALEKDLTAKGGIYVVLSVQLNARARACVRCLQLSKCLRNLFAQSSGVYRVRCRPTNSPSVKSQKACTRT